MILVTCVVLGVLGLGVANAANLPSSEQARIIGGVDAPQAYSPHMAALIIGGPVQMLLCGGSIISKSLVLTAAHCIDVVIQPNGQLRETFHMRVSSNQWNSGGIIVHVKKYHNHPQWDPQNIKYDAGILVMAEQLTLSDNVQVVTLGVQFVEGGEESLVTGWGRTGPRFEGNVVHLQPTPANLQLIYINTLNQEDCQKQMREVAGNIWTPDIQKDVEICTFHSRGHGLCVGDSGSALLQLRTRQLVGIVSWGFNCAIGAPDIYVRISGVRTFIETIMNVYMEAC